MNSDLRFADAYHRAIKASINPLGCNGTITT